MLRGCETQNNTLKSLYHTEPTGALSILMNVKQCCWYLLPIGTPPTQRALRYAASLIVFIGRLFINFVPAWRPKVLTAQPLVEALLAKAWISCNPTVQTTFRMSMIARYSQQPLQAASSSSSGPDAKARETLGVYLWPARLGKIVMNSHLQTCAV